VQKHFFADFVIEHNLPLALLIMLVLSAAKYFHIRLLLPNTAVVVQGPVTLQSADALAEDDRKHIAAITHRQPFSVATDGSNDIGSLPGI